MRYLSIFLILLLFGIVSQQGITEEVNFISQPDDFLWQQTYCWQPGNPYRPILPLDGEWEYKVNEKDSYQKVILPASCDYWGEITFRKSFVPDSSFNSRFFRLICYGINYYCRIFINEKFIGSHAGGYSAFAYDIADGIIKISQKNIIEIKVDTRLDSKGTIPHRFQPDGIRQTAGIFRSLYLLAIPEFSIEDVIVDYQFIQGLSQCELDLKFKLKDRIDNITNQVSKRQLPIYYIEIRAKDSDRSILQQWKEIDTRDYLVTRTISTKLNINQPQLWSPESPHLYSLRIQLLQGRQTIDQFDLSLGMKQIDFRDGNIYLNGSRLVLKGVNWVEDYRVDGALLDRNQLVKDLEMIKQLHANAIRVLHHQAHPIVTALCDSLGLFLLQEMPLDWMPSPRFASDIFVGLYRDYLNETISRDQAHVSVFAYGIGGHLLFSDAATKNFISQITGNANPASSQPFYVWNSPPFSAHSNVPDVITGISIFNLEKNQIQNNLSEWIEQSKGAINLVLSYGSPQWAVPSGNDNRALFEEYQVLQIVDAWQTINSFPEIDGYFISTFSDYQGNYPSTIYKNCQGNSLRPFGLTDVNRAKRAVFETVKALYQEGKTRFNPGVDIRDEPPAIFAVIGLAAILLFLFIINSRRYFRENFKRIFIHPHGFYVDLRDGRKIPASQTTIMAFFISVGCGLVLASLLIFFKDQPIIDHLATILIPSSDLKMKICYLSWNPGWAILILTVFSFLVFILIALYFKLLSLVSRKRCSISQCFITPFWLGGNLLIFIPVGMVLFRLMQYQNLVTYTLILLLIIVIWFILRVGKGMRVMYIWPISRALLVLIITIIALLAGILYYYQSHYGLIDYLKFYYQIYGAQLFTGSLH